MNDMIVVVSAVGVVVGLLAFAFFHTFYGVNDNLTNAKVGKVYNFIYEQPLHGEPERFMAKIIDVHTLDEKSIARLNRKSRYRVNDPNFMRTNHLVTAQTFDGKIRNFYAERTKNVRRPLLGNMMFKTGLVSLLF